MTTSFFAIESFYDDLGPQLIAYVHEPWCGLHGMVVIDNTACGPAIGGVRMALDVTVEEVFRRHGP